MTKLFSLLIAAITLASAADAQKIGCSVTDKHRTLPGAQLRISGLDTTKERSLADNYYLWDVGQTLKVKFLSGSPMLQERVKKLSKVWETHANIKFNFVEPDEEAHIRVMLGTGEGHYSFIGLVSKLIPADEQTMALDTLDLGTNMAAWQRTVQHEFGHALGLLHEHSSPISGIKWNKEKMYEHYAKMGWTREDVDAQVFKSYSVTYTNGTTYDKKSIMHYPVLAWQTLDGYAVPWNSNISEGDKGIMNILYPKSGVRAKEVPRFALDNFTKINSSKNENKGGVSFFPSFDITASGTSGKVYFAVLFFDEEGYGVEDADGNYAFGRTVAAVRSVNMTGGQKMASNKNGAKDFELFIPYSEIHVPDGLHNFLVEFRVVQVTDEGEIKYIYQSGVEKFTLNKKPAAAAQNKAPKSNSKPAAKKKG